MVTWNTKNSLELSAPLSPSLWELRDSQVELQCAHHCVSRLSLGSWSTGSLMTDVFLSAQKCTKCSGDRGSSWLSCP